MARPPLAPEKLRSRTIGVRVTPAEAAAIAERAAEARTTSADYMRRRTLGKPTRVTAVHRLAAEERVELQRIGANLNQVARALNSGVVEVPAGTLEDLERLADLVADLLTEEAWG
ncbi:MAG: plasmid mobilization relaxosome protein MobC [Defluviicoccus sp.]|nr:plasmid mobilization relaxosome protein MobC [Defluviicoccus sp.]